MNRKERMRKQVEGYPTNPTWQMAIDLGMQEDTVRRRANRYGLRKLTPWKNTRKPKDPSIRYRLVLIFAKDYSVEKIADKVGFARSYVRKIIREAGLTPIEEQKPIKTIVQWSKDGQIIARYPTCRAAAKAIGRPHCFSGIYSCVNGKPRFKSAYGYRWTQEIIYPKTISENNID